MKTKRGQSPFIDNCISDLGNLKFKPLLESSMFLEHLPVYDSFRMPDVNLYDKKVFGDSWEWNEYLEQH